MKPYHCIITLVASGAIVAVSQDGDLREEVPAIKTGEETREVNTGTYYTQWINEHTIEQPCSTTISNPSTVCYTTGQQIVWEQLLGEVEQAPSGGSQEESSSSQGAELCGMPPSGGGSNEPSESICRFLKIYEECKEYTRFETADLHGCPDGRCGRTYNPNPYTWDTPSPTCVLSPGVQSVLIKFGLGYGKDGTMAGDFRLHHAKPTPLLFEARGLKLEIDESQVDVLRDDAFAIRQILSPQFIVDVVISPNGFRLHYYKRTKNLKREKGGLLVAEGSPERSIAVARPADARGNDIVLLTEEVNGKLARKFRYEWDAALGQWQYWLEDSDSRQSIRHFMDEKAGLKMSEKAILDKDGKLISKEISYSEKQGSGYRHFKMIKEDGKGNKLESITSYYDTPNDPSRHGKVKSHADYDGKWSVFGYDTRGNVSYEITPWKDSPLTENPREAKTTYYESRYLRSGEVFYHPDAQMRIKRVEILGIPVEKSFSVTSTDRFGGRVEISEACLDPSGNYGDPGNRRSVSTYFPDKEFDPTSGRLRSSWSSSGTLTRYTYARGEFLGGGGMPGDFKVDPSHTQLFTRVESVTTPNSLPEGIPNLTTKDVSIYDKFAW